MDATTRAAADAIEAQQTDWMQEAHNAWPERQTCERLAFSLMRSLEANWTITGDFFTNLTGEGAYTMHALLRNALEHIILEHDTVHPTWSHGCYICQYRLMIVQSFQAQCPSHGPEHAVIWCQSLHMIEPRYQANLDKWAEERKQQEEAGQAS